MTLTTTKFRGGNLVGRAIRLFTADRTGDHLPPTVTFANFNSTESEMFPSATVPNVINGRFGSIESGGNLSSRRFAVSAKLVNDTSIGFGQNRIGRYLTFILHPIVNNCPSKITLPRSPFQIGQAVIRAIVVKMVGVGLIRQWQNAESKQNQSMNGIISHFARFNVRPTDTHISVITNTGLQDSFRLGIFHATKIRNNVSRVNGAGHPYFRFNFFGGKIGVVHSDKATPLSVWIRVVERLNSFLRPASILPQNPYKTELFA